MAVSVCAVEKGQTAPSHSQLWPEPWVRKPGARRSAVVMPKGAQKLDGVGELGPGGFVAFVLIGQFEVPGGEANFFAEAGEIAIGPLLLEELGVGVPKRISCMDGFFDGGGIWFAYFGCKVGLPGELCDFGDGQGVAVHVAADGGAARKSAWRAAVDGIFHGVLGFFLPVEAARGEVSFFPFGVVAEKIGEEVGDENFVVIHQVALIGGPDGPTAEFVECQTVSRHCRRASSSQILIHDGGVVNPAAFHEVMADGAADGIFPSEKFGEADVGGSTTCLMCLRKPQKRK